MARQARMLFPVALVAAGIVVAVVLVRCGPRPTQETAAAPRVAVRVEPVLAVPLRLDVTVHGVVTPRTESELVAEVPGRVVRVAHSLAAGGFFDAGDLLVEIDPREYETALRRARASVVRRDSEHRLAERRLERVRRLAEQGVASSSELEEAEHGERIAFALRREAEADVAAAELDLERVRLHAPFSGRVRRKSVDVGQFVQRGHALASLYAVDYAEVRLPVPVSQLAFLELPLRTLGREPFEGPRVRLRAEFAAAHHEWTGRIVRSEGEIDTRSRVIHLIARVDDPYGRGDDGRPPLAVGLFVDAEIEGREIARAHVVPPSALVGRDTVLVVDDESRIRRRTLDVLRHESDRVIVSGGLRDGDLVCLSPSLLVPGTNVRPLIEKPSLAAGSGPVP